jgi:hypothetical protein
MPAAAHAHSQDVIVADREDDLGSLRSKIESTAAEEIFLVLPREAVVLRTPVEFRVFARMLQSLGSELVVVSGDGERRRLARMAGFRTRRGLRGLLHLMPPDEAERYRFRWYRVWRWFPVMTVVSVLVPLLGGLGLLGVVFVVLPELRVTMAPATDVDSALLDLRVDPAIRQADPEGRRLPGVTLQQRFEIEGQVPASGTGRRPSDVAQGTVTFVNSQQNVFVVPRGLVLVATNGLRLATDADVEVPPNNLVGVRVGVHALEPGQAGNVAAMAITRLADPGPRGLAVFNERPTAGGRDEEYAETAERDYIVLREELRQMAQQTAWQQLAALARDDYTIIPETVRVDTERETFSPGLRAASPEVTGRLTAQVTAVAFSNVGMTRLAEAAWAASLPAGFRPLGGTVEMTLPEYLGMEAGGGLYRVGVRGRIARVMDAGVLAERLRGASLAEARAALAAREGLDDPVEVEMWPSWAPRAFRLQLLQRRTE